MLISFFENQTKQAVKFIDHKERDVQHGAVIAEIAHGEADKDGRICRVVPPVAFDAGCLDVFARLCFYRNDVCSSLEDEIYLMGSLSPITRRHFKAVNQRLVNIVFSQGALKLGKQTVVFRKSSRGEMRQTPQNAYIHQIDFKGTQIIVTV